MLGYKVFQKISVTKFLFWTSEIIFLKENNFRKIQMIFNQFIGRIWHFLRTHHIYGCSQIKYLRSFFFFKFAFLDATWCITVSQQLVVLEKYAPTRWYWTRTTDAQWSLFFIEIPKFWAWADNLGRLGIFDQFISTHFGNVWIPCHCFPLINHYLHKKLSLYIQIPNIYNLGC